MRERYRRRAALVTGTFKKGTVETDLYGLPFDDELTHSDAGYDIEEFYKNAIKGLN